MRRNAWSPSAAISIVLMLVGCQAATQAPMRRAVAPPTAAIATPPAEIPHAAAPTKVAPKIPPKKETGPQTRTAFYRADTKPASIPRVLLSKREEALCRVKVGDQLPPISLPKVGGRSETKLADLYGKKGTVVVFWKSDRRMTLQELADLGPDIVEPFGPKGIAVIGIAVEETASSAQAELEKTGASFTNLLDADGKAFAQVGSAKLPRTYVLDSNGKILWFDIEYSLASRRELHQTLRAVAARPASGDAGARQE